VSAEAFGRFLDIMLPRGGCAVTFSEVYIDESYDDQEPPLLVVGGYLSEKRKAADFSRKWAAYLERKGLPYFHMSECAHAAGPFEGKDCDAVARELIRRTRASTEFGFAVAINEHDYTELVGPRDGMKSAYGFALMMCMNHVRNWKERNGFGGPTAFFFEEGHKHQGDAHAWLTWMLKSDALRAAIGYSGHAFLPKPTPGLHPADNLAWHWRLESKRRYQADRIRPRRDFLALRRPTDMLAEVSRQRLEEFAATLKRGEIYRDGAIRLALETGSMPQGATQMAS
jgi:hypothetical protein